MDSVRVCQNCKFAQWHFSIFINPLFNTLTGSYNVDHTPFTDQFDVLCQLDGKCFLEEEVADDCDRFVYEPDISSFNKECGYYYSIIDVLYKLARRYTTIYNRLFIDENVDIPNWVKYIDGYDNTILDKIKNHNEENDEI